jgi:hypothetical protein
MRINERFEIRGGKGDFILVEHREGTNSKTKLPTMTEIKTYHPSLGYCAKKIIKVYGIDAMALDSIDEVVSSLNAIEAALIETLSYADADKEPTQ